jgi:hypothetical protein
MSLKHELQNIISGNGSVRNGKIIQAITDYLRRKKETVQGITKAKLDKEQETLVLIEFVGTQSLWYNDVERSQTINKHLNCM